MSWIRLPDSATVGTRWITRLIDSIGTPDMDSAMFEVARSLAPVEEISGYLIFDDAPARPFGWYGQRADSGKRVAAYAQHYAGRDPLLVEARSRRSAGMMLVRHCNVSVVADDQYRWDCFEEPDFRSRVAMVRTNPRGWSMINFALGEDAPSAATLDALTNFSIASFPIVRRHFGLPDWNHRSDAVHETKSIDVRLGERFPNLTGRERSVCALTMVGYTSREIAKRLKISPATVLTYRSRAYDRLGVSSASELVPHIL